MVVYRGAKRVHWGYRNNRQGVGQQDINHVAVVGSGKIEFYVVNDTNHFVFVRVRGDSDAAALQNLEDNGYRKIANYIRSGNSSYILTTPTDYKSGAYKSAKPQPQPLRFNPEQAIQLTNLVGSGTHEYYVVKSDNDEVYMRVKANDILGAQQYLQNNEPYVYNYLTRANPILYLTPKSNYELRMHNGTGQTVNKV